MASRVALGRVSGEVAQMVAAISSSLQDEVLVVHIDEFAKTDR